MQEHIKNLARDAKHRLIKSQYIQRAKICEDTDLPEMQNYIISENQKLLLAEQDEEQILWKKVCQIMESDEFISPISKLIDHNKYDSLNEMAKQNYILELTNKYSELKERYLREKEYLAKQA